MNTCVVCRQPTASTTPGQHGDRTGVICPNCAYWCDGNVMTT